MDLHMQIKKVFTSNIKYDIISHIKKFMFLVKLECFTYLIELP